ncbi:MAG: hypothetical protein RR822_01990 [Raoultibacter sp.]
MFIQLPGGANLYVRLQTLSVVSHMNLCVSDAQGFSITEHLMVGYLAGLIRRRNRQIGYFFRYD